MEESKPYYVYEVKNKNYFWCEKCKKHHKPDEAIYFYNVCVHIYNSEDECMNNCRSCSREYAQQLVDGFNKRHNKVREWSTRNGGKPIIV